MKNKYFHIWLAAFLALPFVLAPSTNRASAQHASAPSGPELTLVAEKHAGLETIAADLGESVSFKATWTGKLQKGEYLAILSGKTLLGKPCAHAHCSGIDSYDTAGTHEYVAELYTKKHVLKKSNVITVDWEDLSLEVTPVSHVVGTLTPDVNADPPAYHQLQGVPIQLSVHASPEFATSWKSVEIIDTGTNQVLYTFDPSGSKHYVDKVSTTDPLGHEYIAKAFDAAGLEVKLSKTVAIFTSPWKVDLNISGPKGSSSGDLDVNLGDQVQITAVIQEPNAQELAQYVGIEIVDNFNNENPKTETDCPASWTCSVSVTRSSEEAIPFTGVAYVKEASGNSQEAGTSQERTVSWAGPPPNPDDYSIEYWISGGTGDCSPAPLGGFSSCYPGPSGSVQLTAQVSFQGHPMTDSQQLPFGYSISWGYSLDPVDIPNCPARAPICTITVNGPASGATIFEATVGSKFNLLAYWTLKLTAAWATPPKPLRMYRAY